MKERRQRQVEWGGGNADAITAPGKTTRLERGLRDAKTTQPIDAEDVATAAVHTADAGAAVDAGIRKRVEPELGVGLSNVRVHADDSAQQASAALGARAFAYRNDIFLGPGESATDLSLMAHELTHVAQQGAGAAVQRKVGVGAENSPAEAEADAVAARIVSGSPQAMIVEDDAQPEGGQLRRSEFLQQLRAQVTATADAALGPMWSAIGCPYIDQWFSRHANTPAPELERLAKRYSRVNNATNARQYVAPICERVRAGVARWTSGGDVSGDLASAGLPGVAVPPAAPDGEAPTETTSTEQVQTKRHGGPAPADASSILTQPAAVKRELGRGDALDSTAASEIGDAYGQSFGHVRVHTDATAARLTASADAAALTVGSHIAFAPGEYNPGTIEGKALLAHELAHVGQQSGAEPSQVAAPSSEAHEADADRAASGALARIYGGVKAMAGRIGPALTSGFALQRCPAKKEDKRKAPTPAPTPGPRTPAPPDLHEGAFVPTVAQVNGVQNILNPSGGGGGARTAWQGSLFVADASGNPTATRKTGADLRAARQLRSRLQRTIRDELKKEMRDKLASANATSRQNRIPLPKFEGATNAAKGTVDSVFGGWASAASVTPNQARHRAAFTYKAYDPATNPDGSLFDSHDPAHRAQTNTSPDARDLADALAAASTRIKAESRAQSFNKRARGEEEDFWDATVNAFADAAANKRKLLKIDLWEYNFAAEGGRIVLTTTVPGPRPTGATPTPQMRAAMWAAWKTACHEYFHTLEHPVFGTAARGPAGGGRTMTEGFPEMFAMEVLLDKGKLAAAPSDAALVAAVEGGIYTPTTDATLIGGYDPGDYTDYVADAKRIRDTAIGGTGGDNAVKAAFFHGHVEYLGLSETGDRLAGRTDPASMCEPKLFMSITELATGVGLTASAIVAANPGMSLTPSSSVPNKLNLPGCRMHKVVEATDRAGGRKSENLANIAAQHGVSEAQLRAANPFITRMGAGRFGWDQLSTTQEVLIPKR